MGVKRHVESPLRARLLRALDWCLAHLGWLPAALAWFFGLLATVSLCVATFFVPEDSETKAAWMVCTLVFVVLGALATGSVEWQRRVQVQARVNESRDLQMLATETLVPALRQLQRVIEVPSDRSESAIAHLIGHVVSAPRTQFFAVSKLRMCVYRYEPSPGGRRAKLVCLRAEGRMDSARDFKETDDRGRAAIEWAKKGRSRFVADTEAETDQSWKGTGRGYRTFISTPIMVQGKLAGMVTVDAPEPGDLDESDKPVVEMLALILGTAMARH